MKTRLLLISMVAVFVAGLSQFYIWVSPKEQSITTFEGIEDKHTITARNTADSQFPNFPIGISQTIELTLDERTKHRLTEREWRDQIRDWLLLTVISDSGLSANDIGNTLFDLPPLRYGYLKASGQFEYGESRSVYIGNNQILALVPANASQETRDDAISDVIDRHRKDQLGEIDTVSLFEYHLSDEDTSAEITQLPSINVALYLRPEKGYHEATIKTLDDLQHFLQNIDDLTYAQMTSKGLILGGRKMQSYEFRGIGIQEVAAIWQSEQDISRKERELKEFIEAEETAYNNRWRNRYYSNNSERIRLENESEKDWQQVDARIIEKAKKLRIVEGSGFSLDPTYDFDGLHESFSTILKELGDSNHLISELKNAVDQLTDKNIIPILTFLDALNVSENLDDNIIAAFLTGLTNQYRFQAARYDGKLQGTEAGMVLFYTDLLAKIWAINYLNSAPINDINGFIDLTRVSRPPIYERESDDLPAARIWFGHTDRGFNIAHDYSRLFFKRISTRIYSKGNNPLSPSDEVQTSAFFSAPIDWWDDHYEEVARYEPEYFRLNEIMKWSTLIGFLAEHDTKNELNFLDSVKVDRSNWFPTWAQNNKLLRFDLWKKIEFFEKGFKNSETEAMAILYSNDEDDNSYLYGGVSLAPKKIFKNRSVVPQDINKMTRRSNIDYSVRLSPGEFRSYEGITYNIENIRLNKVSLQSIPSPDLRFRSLDSDVVNKPIARHITQQTNGMKLEASIGGNGIGEFNIVKTPHGYKATWSSGELDAGQSLVLQASRSPDPEVVFSSDPFVKQLVKLPAPNNYAVKLHDNDKWMVVAKGGGGDSTVGGGWHSRVSNPDGGESYLIKLVDRNTIENNLQKEQWITYTEPSGGRLVAADISIRGPPSQGTSNVTLLIEGKTVKATVDDATGAVFIPKKDLSGATPKQLLETSNRFDHAQLEKIRHGARTSDEPLLISSTRSPEIQSALQKSDNQSVANKIVENPATAKLELEKAIANDFNQFFRLRDDGKIQNSLLELDKMQQKYGPQADIIYAKADIELSQGKFLQAIETLGKEKMGHSGNPSVFKEISSAYPLRDPQIGAKAIPKEDSLATNMLGRTVYRQDSSSLNSLDWNMSAEKAIHQALEMDRVAVFMLSDSNIANFNPVKIITHTELKNTQKTSQIEFLPVPAMKMNPVIRNPGGITENNDCLNDQNNDNLECNTQNQVYLILVNND